MREFQDSKGMFIDGRKLFGCEVHPRDGIFPLNI